MMYAFQSPFTQVTDKFEYHLEDFDCKICADSVGMKEKKCGRPVCRFQDLKDEAKIKNRIKRERKWQEKCMEE